MKPSEIYEAHDVVVIPFPFTDNIAKSKRRPAVVVSSARFHSHTGQLTCAMITSTNAPWPLDVAIRDLEKAGLPKPCFIRMKLFTLDVRFVLRKAGTLSTRDGKSLQKSLHSLLRLS